MGWAAGPYRTVKALVFDHVHRHRGVVDYKALTDEVLKHFPDSRWKESHWSWYRYQIRRGRFRNQFSDEERENLGPLPKGPVAAPTAPTEGPAPDEAPARGRLRPRDPQVKRVGDKILDHIRFVISQAAGEDHDLRFKLNRWIFARLQQDEIRLKRPIKQHLWDAGMRSCQACGQRFASLRGVHLHRRDSDATYSAENCELLCRECHQELERRR